MANIQQMQTAAFALRRKTGQLRTLLYIEGPVTYLKAPVRTVFSAEYSESVEVYQKKIKRDTDHGVKLADHDKGFVWSAVNRAGGPAHQPVRDSFLIDQESGEAWRITHVKPQGAWETTHEVVCKPFHGGSVAVQQEVEVNSVAGASATISISVTDLLYVRPPVAGDPRWGEFDLDGDWQVIPKSVFGPPVGGIYGDVRTVCISSAQAVGLGSVEFEIQRSAEPEGVGLWQSIGSGIAQVDGQDILRLDFPDSPPWIPAENRLLYRVRARAVSGYATIFNHEFAVKAEVIIQKTKGFYSLDFTGPDLTSWPVSIGSLPAGSYLDEIVTDLKDIMGASVSIGTAEEPTLYGDSLSAGRSHVGVIKKRVSGDIFISASGLPATGTGSVIVTFII